MSEIVQYVLVFAAVLALILIGLKLFKVTLKTILTVAINAIIGGAAIWLLNLIPAVNIPLTWWTAIPVGIFGIPAVLVLLIIGLFEFAQGLPLAGVCAVKKSLTYVRDFFIL